MRVLASLHRGKRSWKVWGGGRRCSILEAELGGEGRTVNCGKKVMG
jgi:hypothetical protein